MEVDHFGNPIVDQFSEEGFIDLTFRMSNLVDDGCQYRFHLVASYHGQLVGMDVVVLKGIKNGLDSRCDLISDHVYRSGVHFRRSGVESDRLIAAIGELYFSESKPVEMIAEESFTAIALHQAEIDMAIEPVKMKLFGRDAEPFDEEAYYECFFNVDLPNRMVYWNEKDSDYRKPLYRALAGIREL